MASRVKNGTIRPILCEHFTQLYIVYGQNVIYNFDSILLADCSVSLATAVCRPGRQPTPTNCHHLDTLPATGSATRTTLRRSAARTAANTSKSLL